MLAVAEEENIVLTRVAREVSVVEATVDLALVLDPTAQQTPEAVVVEDNGFQMDRHRVVLAALAS